MRGNQGNAGTSGKHRRKNSQLEKNLHVGKSEPFQILREKVNMDAYSIFFKARCKTNILLSDFFPDVINVINTFITSKCKFWTIGTSWHFVKSEAYIFIVFFFSHVFHLYQLLSNTESSLSFLSFFFFFNELQRLH